MDRSNDEEQLERMSDFSKMHLGDIALVYIKNQYQSHRLNSEEKSFLLSLFEERIDDGENFLRSTYKTLWHDFFPNAQPQIVPFDNQLSYLGFLYRNTPRCLQEGLEAMKKSDNYIKRYRRIFDSVPNSDRLSGSNLAKIGANKEVMYSGDLGKNEVIMIGGRRKTLERLVNKTITRIAKTKEMERKSKRDPSIVTRSKNPEVTDMFGLEIVTMTPEGAKNLAIKTYKALADYNLRPDSRTEPAMVHTLDENGQKITIYRGEQAPGFDDHYKYGPGNDHLYQINALRTDGKIGMIELIFRDYLNKLSDDMNHTSYRAGQINAQKPKCLADKRTLRVQKKRGQELIEPFPKFKRRIFGPGNF